MNQSSVLSKRQGIGSSGTGFAFVLAQIMELHPDTNICLAQDIRTGDQYQVGLNKRGETAWPQIGDQWVLDRSLGHWALQCKVTDFQAPAFTGHFNTMDPDVLRLITILKGLGLIQDATTAGPVPDYSWKTPTLSTGWTPFTAAQAPRYMLNPDNSVSVEGRAVPPASVANGALVFTLPAGYRPPITKYSTVNVANGVAGDLIFDSDGTVKLWDFGATTPTRLLFHARFSLTP